jgi:sugar phosphate isomerase/epimerase
MAELAVVAPFGFSFEPTRFLAAYKALGVTSLQFYRNDQHPAPVNEALRVASSLGLRYDSIHGVFGPHLAPCSPDAAHRAHCLKVYEDEGRLARDLGGPMVVVHPSAQSPGLKVLSIDEIRAYSATHYRYLDAWLKELAAVGERLGVTYLIENQPPNCPLGHDPVELAAHVRAAGSSRVSMCYDTGHAHMTCDVASSLRGAGEVVTYLHVHDNDSKVDDHRMPGEGTIDWDGFAGVLRDTGLRATRMLETFAPESRVEDLVAQGFGAKLRTALAL